MSSLRIDYPSYRYICARIMNLFKPGLAYDIFIVEISIGIYKWNVYIRFVYLAINDKTIRIICLMVFFFNIIKL